MGGRKPDSSEEAQWEKLTRFVQLYSWLTIGGVLFWDIWLQGLPMDNQTSDEFMPTEFTELFIDIHFRFHWGKYLSAPDSSTGVEYRKKQCPKWDDFLTLRKKMDPHDIFLTSYLAAHLGIKTPLPSLAARSSSGAQH
jgi:hypothetical protein